MRRIGATLTCVSLAMELCGGKALADSGQEAIAKMAAVWDQINSYQCTVTVHETQGARTQDRVYLVRFEKPTQTRVDIIGGDGRGSVAIWNGGDTVRGHEGGLFSMIKLNVDMHDRLATDIRGTAIDQASFGALITHLKSFDPSLVTATTDGSKTILVAQVDPSAPEGDVTKEVYILGPDWLPMEHFLYDEDKIVRHVINTGLMTNVDFPASTWQF